MDYTTIRISIPFRDFLQDHAHKGESYEAVAIRLLTAAGHTIPEPINDT